MVLLLLIRQSEHKHSLTFRV